MDGRVAGSVRERRVSRTIVLHPYGATPNGGRSDRRWSNGSSTAPTSARRVKPRAGRSEKRYDRHTVAACQVESFMGRRLFGLKDGDRRRFLRYVCPLAGVLDFADRAKLHPYLQLHKRPPLGLRCVGGKRIWVSPTGQKATPHHFA